MLTTSPIPYHSKFSVLGVSRLEWTYYGFKHRVLTANLVVIPTIASSSVLGGFKVGLRLSINSTTGVLDAADKLHITPSNKFKFRWYNSWDNLS